MMALPKVATSVTSLLVRRLSGNKAGNKVATDWQHYGQADHGPWDRTGKLKAEMLKSESSYAYDMAVDISKERRVRARVV